MRQLLLIAALFFTPLAHASECGELHFTDAEQRLAEATDQRSQVLFEALSHRRDARALLARALLAGSARKYQCTEGRWAAIPAGMPQWRASALAQQAAAAADVDTLVLTLLDGDARRFGFTSAERNALRERLVALDPHNLAVHMLAPAFMSEDDAEFDRWLEVAAESTHYTVHYTGTVAMLLDLAGSAAAPPMWMVEAAALALAGSTDDVERWDAAIVDFILAMGHAMARPVPAMQPLTRRCDPQRDGAWSEQRAERCLLVARTLAMHSDIGIGDFIGLVVWHRLVEGSAAEAEVIALRRRRSWQREAALDTLDFVGADAAQARALIRYWRESHSESEVERQRLRAAGISLAPPDGWQPRNPAELQPRPQTVSPPQAGS
jgi:hypothetical protein